MAGKLSKFLLFTAAAGAAAAGAYYYLQNKNASKYDDLDEDDDFDDFSDDLDEDDDDDSSRSYVDLNPDKVVETVIHAAEDCGCGCGGCHAADDETEEAEITETAETAQDTKVDTDKKTDVKNESNRKTDFYAGPEGIATSLDEYDAYIKNIKETELFLPDEYYEKLNKEIHKSYQAPNTREVYRRLGNTSNKIETSVIISDEFGRIKYRIDYTTHGRDLAHTNPHIHEFVGSRGKGDYHISELRYFEDESTGKMRLGKANNNGTYRWLDMEE